MQIETVDGETMSMTQSSLINTIIKSTGLDDASKQHQTSDVSPLIHKHEYPAPFDEKWSYRSLIGMLTYLVRNTCPGIEHSVHQCARF